MLTLCRDLQRETIGTASECIVLIGQNKKYVLAALGMFLSQVPRWVTFTVGMHVMLALAREHSMNLGCAPIHIFVNIVSMI
jgi:hypothetical protein